MKEKAITVTIRGGESYRNALSAYAKNHGTQISDIVRQSVDAYLGDALAPYLALSLAQNGNSNHQNN